MLKEKLSYFSKTEKPLFCTSVTLIVAAFVIFDRGNPLTLIASLIGVTSLTFAAKGHPISQALIIIFSLLYGVISYRCRYYGEMVTYLGMTMPMAAAALIAWLKNPFADGSAQVAVSTIHKSEIPGICLMTAAVTAVFYFILKYFGTANLIPSTLSVTTSFAAVYLTYRRSAYYAVAYAANDLVLIILWVMAAMQDMSYISVAVCFTAFFANDIYGFISWKRMERQQLDALMKRKPI